MRVTRDMLHPDLQPYYNRVRFFAWIFKLKWLTHLFNFALSRGVAGRDVEGLHCEEFSIQRRDGSGQIRVRIYRPLEHDDPLPVMVYFHGGGYVAGNPEMFADGIKRFIDRRPCVVVAPDYVKAYQQPFPAGFNDCYDTLIWARDNVENLNAKAGPIMVAGHSAGGGLTAAVSLKARDTGDLDIAFQMPIYPMIDDRQLDDPERQIEAPIWNSDTNRIAWRAYLAGCREHGEEISAYAAPARCQNYQGLPPTISFVGTLEPFYRETQSYMRALQQAGTEVEYQEFENCFHGFDDITDQAGISQAAVAFVLDAYARFYDRYLTS